MIRWPDRAQAVDAGFPPLGVRNPGLEGKDEVIRPRPGVGAGAIARVGRDPFRVPPDRRRRGVQRRPPLVQGASASARCQVPRASPAPGLLHLRDPQRPTRHSPSLVASGRPSSGVILVGQSRRMRRRSTFEHAQRARCIPGGECCMVTKICHRTRARPRVGAPRDRGQRPGGGRTWSADGVCARPQDNPRMPSPAQRASQTCSGNVRRGPAMGVREWISSSRFSL
jgi:hypothetical protein